MQRDEVLGRMVVCGFLTEDEKVAAMREPIRLISEESRHKDSSYVREAIRGQLQMILDQHDIRSGGLRIQTTVDAALQKRQDELLGQSLSPIEKKDASRLQAAMIALDPETGGVLALSGGRNYTRSPFNRAYMARRDLGPAFTPFLTAMALERNKVPLDGQPVQTGRQLGIQETIRLSRRVGFSGPFAETEDLYRGTIAASPVELAVAASVLAAEGKKYEPYLITRITDMGGSVLYEREPEHSQAMRKDVAEEAVVELGGGKGPMCSVTASRHDAWAISADEEMVTVLWLGHDKPQTIGSSAVVRKVLDRLMRQQGD